MPYRHRNLVRRVLKVSAMACLVAGVAAGAAYGLRESKPADPLFGRARVPVRRGDLHVTLRAPGLVDSSQKTLIECEVEAAAMSNNGRAIRTNGSTTILTLAPDGGNVREGDVIAELDSSDYEELVRQQQIQVDQSRAQFESATHDLEAAEARLFEYKEGTLEQLKQQIQGQIALARSEVQRQLDRLAWTKKMIAVQYLPENRMSQEQQTLDRLQIDLKAKLLSLTNLETYSAPKQVISMEAQIAAAQSRQTYGQIQLDRHIERLEYFNEQVARCTIRAPHDGFLIYANENDGDTRIETGAVVRQKQDMFYLPDLTKMEVQTVLHETIVDRIKDGMTAQIRIEALPNLRLEGHVVAVAPLPVTSNSRSSNNEVKNFIGRVQLHAVPEGLRPGMSAEVEILTDRRTDTLLVPPSAVTFEGGREVCYVAGVSGPERRHVSLGAMTTDLVEITDGLSEGEEVLLDPTQLEGLDIETAGVGEEAITPLTADAETPTITTAEVSQPAL